MMCQFHGKIFIIRPVSAVRLSWHIINPTSHHDELPLCQRKENNLLYRYGSQVKRVAECHYNCGNSPPPPKKTILIEMVRKGVMIYLL